MTLDELMAFGHVVYSDGKGNVTEPESTEYGPELGYASVDSKGSLTGDPVNMPGYGDWELLKGFSPEMGNFMTEILPNSAFIGGGLERHIRENPGFYVAVMIDADDASDDDDDRSIGWGVAFKETV